MPENNEEISINYVSSRKISNRNDIIVNNVFSYKVAIEVTQQNEDLESKSVEEWRQRNDWPIWKDAIQVELGSFEKREVFRPIVQKPESINLVGYKWVFVKKQNEKNEVVIYKAWLVAQEFSQRHSIDYMETYSPMVDAIIQFIKNLKCIEWMSLQPIYMAH